MTTAGTTADLADAAARQQGTGRLDRTLFVEAGAGSGKTRALTDRVLATVLHPETPVPIRHVAAVTFTEKAGAELRDRLRVALEAELAADGPPDRARLAAEALEDLDVAAIGTLHAFAQRILREHPIEAGLPPLVEILDEVASGVTFDERWAGTRAALLDDPEAGPALLYVLAAGLRPDDLRPIARAFTDHWDLLETRILATPPDPLPDLDATGLATEAHRLVALGEHCTDAADLFLPKLAALAAWTDRLAAAPDDPARLAVLAEATRLKWGGVGRAGNWTGCGLAQLKQDCAGLVERAAELRARALDIALRRLARQLAAATLDAAQARRDDGRLEFHDLLVLARDLLRGPRHAAAVRAVLQRRYRRLLLDEFQDTDPIQIELAVRIAGGAGAAATDWREVRVPDGRLFVVGDPKQSIYRFRGADIATYLDAQARIGDQVVLQTNFRSAAPVLDWINHVFGRLITPEPGSQPDYRPLRPHRPAAPTGPAVLVLGAQPHADTPSAGELRSREAADVAAAVHAALAERWQVAEQRRRPGGHTEQCWRDVTLRDIAVLVPARTSLPYLQEALDGAGLPYSTEASSLTYRSREVRDLLTAARAVEDPSDALTLVAALRSTLFGCGDDDLWSWHRAGGRWNILAPVPDAVPGTHPVRDAVGYLRRLHDDRLWLAPSEVLGRLVADRRMFEVAAGAPRPRDVWRRLRYVVDQARAWSDTEHGPHRAYLAWASRQGGEAARVAEAVLPETDTDALRIMTIHAAKGLEFPVVIVSGLSSQPGGARTGVQVLWPPAGGCQFRLAKDLQTTEYAAAKPIDEQMDYHERLRLLYVACTRARDHLVVSLHRKTRRNPPSDERVRTNAELLANASADAPAQEALAGAPAAPAAYPAQPPQRHAQPPPYEQWREAITLVRTRTGRPAAVSASQFEGTPGTAAARSTATDRLGEPTDPGLAKDARDLDLPPWNKGRYGTAIGRAVHGVLQTVDLATGQGLDHAVAAQTLAEGVAQHTGIVTQLARAALASDIVRRAALRPHWRETYVGTVVGDRVLEGIVDLLYRDDDGLVIVDYKTDTVPPAAVQHRVAFYRPQLAAYAAALQAATSHPLARCVLLFLSPHAATERTVDGIDAAAAHLRATMRSG